MRGILVCFLVLTTVYMTSATTYYFVQGGQSGKSACTQAASPCAPTKAQNFFFQPGDILHYKAASNTATSQKTILEIRGARGSASNPVRIVSDIPQFASFKISNSSHVSIQSGLKVKLLTRDVYSNYYYGVWIQRSQYVTVPSITVENVNVGIVLEDTSYVTVTSPTVKDALKEALKITKTNSSFTKNIETNGVFTQIGAAIPVIVQTSASKATGNKLDGRSIVDVIVP